MWNGLVTATPTLIFPAFFSLLAAARGPSGGNYTFVMIGDPSAPFFATAHNKGIRNYDIEKAYEGLRKNAFVGGSRDHAARCATQILP